MFFVVIGYLPVQSTANNACLSFIFVNVLLQTSMNTKHNTTLRFYSLFCVAFVDMVHRSGLTKDGVTHTLKIYQVYITLTLELPKTVRAHTPAHTHTTKVRTKRFLLRVGARPP